MRWEYLVRVLPEMKPQEEVLNPLGEQEWELVSVVAYEGQRVAYFKRPITQDSGTQCSCMLAQVGESQQAYEAGQVRRGTATDFMTELDKEDFEARVLQVIRRHIR